MVKTRAMKNKGGCLVGRKKEAPNGGCKIGRKKAGSDEVKPKSKPKRTAAQLKMAAMSAKRPKKSPPKKAAKPFEPKRPTKGQVEAAKAKARAMRPKKPKGGRIINKPRKGIATIPKRRKTGFSAILEDAKKFGKKK